MVSPTEENYLKALLYLAGEDDTISISDLGDLLKVSTPTANSMAKKLHAKGWVLYEKYRPLKLTGQGRTEAAKVVRKHRLTEMFLVQKMGFGWEEVHEIAEQMEHVRSSKLFERMDQMLDHPTIDPHGSPIPDKHGKMPQQAYVSLVDCKPGDQVTITALTNSSPEFLRFLNEKEIILGMELHITHKEPFDGSMTFQYKDKQAITFSRIVCEGFLVELSK